MLSYGVKTVPMSLRILMRALLGFSRNKFCRHGTYSHATPWIPNARVVQAVRSVRRSSFIVFSINLRGVSTLDAPQCASEAGF